MGIRFISTEWRKRWRWFITIVSVVLLPIVFTSSIHYRIPQDLIFVQVPVQAEQTYEDAVQGQFPSNRYVDGARIVRLPATGSETKILTPEFAAACDPDISFDGQVIVFSGKRNPDESWHIWRMNADGSHKVQITHGEGNDITPTFAGNRFYLNDPQPTPQIIFASSASGWKNENEKTPAFALYGTDHQGEIVRRLTFNLNSDFAPDVLTDGRIVFSSRQQFGDRFGSNGFGALMGVNIDGTDLMTYYGNHEMPPFKDMIHVSDFGDRVYFIESDQSTGLGGGAIAFVSRRRPLRSYVRMSQDDDGLFHSPCPLPDNGLTASYRSQEKNAVFGIYRIDPETGIRQEGIFKQEGWHSIDAHVLVSSPTPKGRSNWLIPGSTTGVFYCLDSYRTNLFEGKELAPGTIKYVRVIEGLPDRLSARNNPATFPATTGSAFGARRLLGIAPVEADGSFHIRVPAEIPITFQLLDENYLALRTQKAWTWVIGNENRGCIGCHEDREMSPPNRMVDAVIKPAVELTLPPSRRRTVDFRNQISNIITSKCATTGCHVSAQASPYLDTSQSYDGVFSAAYETLLKPIQGRNNEHYIVPGNAKESPLIWLLFGRRMGSDQTHYTKEITLMPPHDGLTNRERIIFIEWVDLGAQWDSRSVAADSQ